MINCLCEIFDRQKPFDLFPGRAVVKGSYHRQPPTHPAGFSHSLTHSLTHPLTHSLPDKSIEVI